MKIKIKKNSAIARRLPLVIIILFLIVILPAVAGTTVRFTLKDANENALTNRKCLVGPLDAPLSAGGGMIAQDTLPKTTDSSGVFYISNMVAQTYAWQVLGPPALTTIYFTVTNSASVLNAHDLQVDAPVSTAVGYTKAQIDALLADLETGGGGGDSFNPTNAVLWEGVTIAGWSNSIFTPTRSATNVVTPANAYTVTGAGTSTANQDYYFYQTVGDDDAYTNANNSLRLWLLPNEDIWAIKSGVTRLYENASSDPVDTWSVVDGTAPAPTVAATTITTYTDTLNLTGAPLLLSASDLIQRGQSIQLFSGVKSVYDTGARRLIISSANSNQFNVAVGDSVSTNTVLTLSNNLVSIATDLNVSGSNIATAFVGGAQAITNRFFPPSRSRVLKGPPVGIANWIDYYNVPGNTVNTGPDEPGEQIFTNSVRFLGTNHIVENLWSNVVVRLDNGWASGISGGRFIENSNKWPTGITYSKSIADAFGVKLHMDFAWEGVAATDQIQQAVRDTQRWNPASIGVLTDINGHYPTRPTLTELRLLINLADEARWSAHHYVNLSNAPATNLPALMFSANHTASRSFFPPEMMTVDYTYLNPSYNDLTSPYKLSFGAKTFVVGGVPDWWTGYPHWNAGYPTSSFGSTNNYRQWLESMVVCGAGFWQPMSAVNASGYLNWWTNTAYHELWGWICGPNSQVPGSRPSIYTNSGTINEVWVRRIGGETNIVMLFNNATNGNVNFTFTADQLGVTSNKVFTVRDIVGATDAGTMTNYFTVSLSQTNTKLYAVWPAPPAKQLELESAITLNGTLTINGLTINKGNVNWTNATGANGVNFIWNGSFLSLTNPLNASAGWVNWFPGAVAIGANQRMAYFTNSSARIGIFQGGMNDWPFFYETANGNVNVQSTFGSSDLILGANRYITLTKGAIATNGVVFTQLTGIPTNSILASSSGITNWTLCNLTNTIGGGGPTWVATNINAAGSFLLSRPTVTISAYP